MIPSEQATNHSFAKFIENTMFCNSADKLAEQQLVGLRFHKFPAKSSRATVRKLTVYWSAQRRSWLAVMWCETVVYWSILTRIARLNERNALEVKDGSSLLPDTNGFELFSKGRCSRWCSIKVSRNWRWQ